MDSRNAEHKTHVQGWHGVQSHTIARPDRLEPFRYRFFCELAAVDDARLRAALTAIGGEQRVLGFY